MASIIPGFEYDIFISYRQKDNKGDRWVSEFVESLKTELDKTFKEEITVYFDVNPHDGLLETHDVSASLKEKLKCLIFIPVISQTYCDPNSFAWQHELVAFNKLAKEDLFGRDISLAGGNVASRILPVRIHDLDREDKAILENELGAVLRPIDFIYKSAGVNRPLRASEDHPQDNLNKTYYRDQINKVANAVKEIISALKRSGKNEGDIPNKTISREPVKKNVFKKKSIIASVTVSALLISGYFIVSNLAETSRQTVKTIAVLPLENFSNDSTQVYFCDGFMYDIISNLQKINSFTVRPGTSSNQYRDTRKTAITIGKELNVKYLVGGSVSWQGNNLKIRIHVSDAIEDKQIWSDDFQGDIKQLLSLQSEIAKEIASELNAILTPEEIKDVERRPTENFEAYNYFLQGSYYDKRSVALDRRTAISLYEKAITLDPDFALAYLRIASCYLKIFFYFEDRSEEILRKSKQAIDKAFEIDPGLPECHLILGEYYYRGFFNYPKALEQFDEVLKVQPGNITAIFLSASANRRAGNWELAAAGYMKAFELDPRSFLYAWETGRTFDFLRNYSKAEEYYNIAYMFQPDYGQSNYALVQLSLRKDGSTAKAGELLVNGISNNRSLLVDSQIVETKLQIEIYDSRFEEALRTLSQFRSDMFHGQLYCRPKYLYYAKIYGLMNNPVLEYSYYDSARVFLEKKIIEMPGDARYYSALGISYAGLGLKEMAIAKSKEAIAMLPLHKSALEGYSMVQNLAQTYVMTGNYPAALEQINYLLSIPGDLCVRILELDQCWAPLKKFPEFTKILKRYSEK